MTTYEDKANRAEAYELADKLIHSMFAGKYDERSLKGDMQRTAQRMVDGILDITDQEVRDFDFTTFESKSDEMVVVTNIPFQSLCAHHLLPFVGVAHVGYVPGEKLAGLSKLPRVVEYCAASLHVQEELTEEIAEMMNSHLDPIGVAVIMEAEHMCMSLRGVEVKGTKTVTSKMTGCFADHNKLARSEFQQIVAQSR